MKTTYNVLIEDIKREFPKFQIVRKRDSDLMIGINDAIQTMTFGENDDEFLTRFVTVIGNTLYVPDYWYDDPDYIDADRIIVLKHELVHMRQRKRYTPFLYALLYLFLPLPIIFAYFRMKFEKAAYEETFRAKLEQYPDTHDLNTASYRERVVQYFVSSEYLWMWPFRASIEAWYDETIKRIQEELHAKDSSI